MTLKILYKDRYSGSDLSLVELKTKESIKRYGGVGYRYLITHRTTSFTAFRTLAGLKRYLKMTGLKMRLSERRKTINIYELKGRYEEISMAGTAIELDRFGKRNCMHPEAWLNNGKYTRAYYKNGRIYYLNPNYPRRTLRYRYE